MWGLIKYVTHDVWSRGTAYTDIVADARRLIRQRLLPVDRCRLMLTCKQSLADDGGNRVPGEWRRAVDAAIKPWIAPAAWFTIMYDVGLWHNPRHGEQVGCGERRALQRFFGPYVSWTVQKAELTLAWDLRAAAWIIVFFSGSRSCGQNNFRPCVWQLLVHIRNRRRTWLSHLKEFAIETVFYTTCEPHDETWNRLRECVETP